MRVESAEWGMRWGLRREHSSHQEWNGQRNIKVHGMLGKQCLVRAVEQMFGEGMTKD